MEFAPMPHRPLHKTIIVVDVEGSGGRGDRFILAMHKALYDIVREAFRESSLEWSNVEHEDRGDGILMIVPADVSKVELIDPFLGQLRTALRHHFAISSPEARIRLRVAMHAGEVLRDDHGFVGHDVDHTFRLSAADQGRRALDAVPSATLALIVSDSFYQAAVAPQLRSIESAAYRRVAVKVKETRAPAWVHVPGHSDLPDLDGPDPPITTAVTPVAELTGPAAADPVTEPSGPRPHVVGTLIVGGVRMGRGSRIGGPTAGRDLTSRRDEADPATSDNEDAS